MTEPAFARLRRSFCDWLLGTDRRLRFGFRLWMVGAGVYVMAGLLLAYEVQEGIAPREPALWLGAIMATGLVCFYALMRSNASQGFSDPELFAPQAVFALACTSAMYAIAGPPRGAALMVVMLIMVFAMFSITPGNQWRLALLSIAMLGLTMLVMNQVEPDVYRTLDERVHFVVLTVVCLAIAFLGGQLSRLRARLREQKTELAAAVERIQRLAMKDELTDLLNRRHMTELLQHELRRFERSGSAFCVAMIDLDHFKRVNDTRGHAAGDALLRAFGREGERTVRGGDRLARWGGEEFLLMLPDTRLKMAQLGVERLRARVAELSVPHDDIELTITVSIGVAEQRAGETVEQTIARADQSLYEAKAGGRNRVVAR